MFSKFKKNKWPLIFTGTNIVLFILFFLLPAVLGFYYSLTDYKRYATANFIGFENYQELFQDPTFYKALFRTFQYMITIVPLNYIVSLSIVTVSKEKQWGKSFYSYLGPYQVLSLGLFGNGCLVSILALSIILSPFWAGNPWLGLLMRMQLWPC